MLKIRACRGLHHHLLHGPEMRHRQATTRRLGEPGTPTRLETCGNSEDILESAMLSLPLTDRSKFNDEGERVCTGTSGISTSALQVAWIPD
jgi:hypothetical protein